MVMIILVCSRSLFTARRARSVASVGVASVTSKTKMDGAMKETQNRRSNPTVPYSASDHVPT